MPSRRELANAIRALSMDAVQKANSGHPGAPMGMADIAEVLWNDFLVHNPQNPQWFNRDRFVLSNGHGAMLLYALLHLSGYDVNTAELKNFRQLHSKTPGHPEYGYAPGVETTTGPLGQGLANAVGFALAEQLLAKRYNRDDCPIVDHYTYAFAGDGCLMEGISHEACSLAGVLGLGKLIVFYDDNGISIDGPVAGWFKDDTPARFAAYGWQVIPTVDGHDPEAIAQAIEAARADPRPSLLCCRTVIGFGAPNKAGTASVHGSPLGEEEIQRTRDELAWSPPPVVIPAELRRAWDAKAKGERAEAAWHQRLEVYQSRYPDAAAELERRINGNFPLQWEEHTQGFIEQVAEAAESIATRVASKNTLTRLAPLLPELVGGSADLSGSNGTLWKGAQVVNPGAGEALAGGNYLHYGVREFAMAAMVNGLALHGGFIPFAGTFLVFSDYARNAVRLAALMRTRSVFVFTHDSIGLGEDGPTHQPVEHLRSLRMIPNLSLWRPCDAVETAVAWRAALERQQGPTALALSRQNLPHQSRTPEQIQAIARGGYILADCDGEPEAVVIATGSEVAIAMGAAAQLTEQGHRIRVVSMPSVDAFEEQSASYRTSVLPEGPVRVAVEAGVTRPWRAVVGFRGAVVGLDNFGESAPAKVLFEHFGFTVEGVVDAVLGCLDRRPGGGG
ncbi:MAG: transketolase [Candidatus Competibacterales bacterium]